MSGVLPSIFIIAKIDLAIYYLSININFANLRNVPLRYCKVYVIAIYLIKSNAGNHSMIIVKQAVVIKHIMPISEIRRIIGTYLGNEDFYWELDYISGDLKIQYIAPYAREEVYHFSNTVRDDTWYSDENGARLGRLELTYDSSDSNYIIDSNELDAEEKSRLDDSSNLLTNAEQEKILSKLNNVSEKNYFDMVIVTVDSLNGKTEQEYADEYYSNNNFGYGSNSEGIILLVAMKERRVRISARGRENTLDDKCIENIMSSVRPELTAKNYYNAFLSFIDLVENSL